MPRPGDPPRELDGETAHPLSLWRRLTGPQLLVTSFLLLILFATALLLLIPGLYTTGETPSFIDSLTMATAAVCITGLTLIDVATGFTPLGQVVYLALIQIGGIGILTITTMVILWLGGRITLRSETTLGTGEGGPIIAPRDLLRAVIRYALGIEAIGAILLWLAWIGEFGAIGAVWPAIFHAISAFSNAGVSNLNGGLIGYRDNPLVLIVIISLIVLGGIGFLVLEEVIGGRRVKRRSLSLHSRLAILTTAILIGGGALIFGILEWNVALQDARWYDRIVQALFLSITPRTAGFAIVDYHNLTTASLSLTIILMMIGGSPGSTAGGLKTTTIAVLVALAIARIRGDTLTRAFRHTIPETTIQRAIGLVIIAITTLTVAILLLQVIELGGIPHGATTNSFIEFTFEAIAAFNTTGLSMGITTNLSSAGKAIMVILMYIGRVGPLTFAASMVIAARRTRPRIRYSTEDLIIG